MSYLLLVIQQLIASSTHLVAKNVTTIMHPAGVVLMRGAFTVTFYGIYYVLRRTSLPKVQRADWMLLLVLGVINLPLNQLCFIWGIKYTTAPNAALAYALTPVFVVVFQAMHKRAWPVRKHLVGIAIAILGTGIVLSDGVSLDATHTLGNVMVLLASASWGLYTILGKRLVHKYGALYATALTFFVGFATYLPVWLLLPIQDSLAPLTDPLVSSSVWLQLFYLGVITSGVGYGLWYFALLRLESHRVAVFNNLQPVITTLLAFVVFGTVPSLLFFVGGCVALVGVVVTQIQE